jgi:hypothetical protein
MPQHEVEAMKRILIAAVLGVVALLGGCATPSESAQEHNQRIAQQWAMQMRMASEDLDAVLLLDRTNMTTEWETRIGE